MVLYFLENVLWHVDQAGNGMCYDDTLALCGHTHTQIRKWTQKVSGKSRPNEPALNV